MTRVPFIGQVLAHHRPPQPDTDLCDISKLQLILSKHSDVFGVTSPIKKVKTGSLNIRLRDPTRIVQRQPYRLAPIEREKVKNIINDLKTKGIIRDSCSSFASPILLVKKKNGDVRLCVDFRELNANTIRDHYPLPLIQDQIDKLGAAKFFTTLDMESGFHQIPIEEESLERQLSSLLMDNSNMSQCHLAFVTPPQSFSEP